MPHSILVASPDRDLFSALGKALAKAGVEGVHMDHAPSRALATRLLSTNKNAFSAVVVDLTDKNEALTIIANLRAGGSKTPLFGAALNEAAQAHAPAAMRAGCKGVFPRVEEFPKLLRDQQTQQRIASKRAKLVLFAPAQDGAGASTAALHTAANLATQHRARTLLAELDFHSDSVAYRLRLGEMKAITDVANGDSWRTAVAHWKGLDILAAPRSGRTLRTRGLPEIANVVAECCQEYEFVIGDLPCNTAVVTSSLLQSADRIFVVATAEVTSLYLARRRVLNLVTAGAETEAIRLVINRDRTGAVDDELAHQVTGFAPHCRLPNDFAAASAAETEAGAIAESSPLGRAYAELAAGLAGKPAAVAAAAPSTWSRLMAWR